MGDAELEAVARAICASRGRDPDASDWVGSLAQRRSLQVVPQWTKYEADARAAVTTLRNREASGESVQIAAADWRLIAGCAAVLCERMSRHGENVADIAAALERSGLSLAGPRSEPALPEPPVPAIPPARASGQRQASPRLPAAMPLQLFLHQDILEFA